MDDNFLKKCNLFYEELDIRENRFPIVSINFANIKKLTSIDREVMRQAIENVFSEIAQIFLEFYSGSFQLDLGTLGKFLLADRNLRYMPFVRAKKVATHKKITVKNIIDMTLRTGPLAPEGYLRSDPKSDSQRDSALLLEEKLKQERDHKHQLDANQKSTLIKSVFSQQTEFVSPIRRTAAPPNYEENKDYNLMFGAGTDPLALNQNFSLMAGDPSNLVKAVFSKAPFARIRCPPVIDLYSRTQAAPVISQYNSFSASSRIGLLYSVPTKFLYFDPDTNEIAYLKIKENKTKLTANEELLQAVATEEEEIQYLIDRDQNRLLEPKIEAKLNCHKRYSEYIEDQIPLEVVAPIRQYWITNVLDLIPANQKDLDQATMERVIDGVLGEINHDYHLAVKKSILDYILREDLEKMRIGILQRFDEPEEYGEAKPKGIMADQNWVDKCDAARTDIRKGLVNYNHATLSIIGVWGEIGKDSFFLLPRPFEQTESPVDFFSRQKKAITAVGGRIKSTWIQEVAKIYHNELGIMDKSEIAKFFTATKMLMSGQLRGLVYKSTTELKDFIARFELPTYLTPQECIENDLDPKKFLQKSFLIVKLIRGDDRKVKLADRTETIRAEVLKLVDEVVGCSENIALPQNNFARLSEKTLFAVNGREDETVLEAKQHIDRVLTDNLNAVDKVTEVFAPFEFLFSESDKLTVVLKNKLSQKEYQKLIDSFRSTAQQIENKIPFEIHMSMIMIDCREIREDLLNQCQLLEKTVLNSVLKNMNLMNSEVSDETKKLFEIFNPRGQSSLNPMDASHYEECDKRKDLIEKKEKARMKAVFNEATEMLFFLYRYSFQVDSSTLTSVRATAEVIHKIDEDLARARDILATMKDAIKGKLGERKESFDANLQNVLRRLEDVKGKEAIEVKDAVNEVTEINNILELCQADAKEINDNQEKLSIRKSGFEELDKVISKVAPFRDLWLTLDKATQDIGRWNKEPIFSIDAQEVIKQTKVMAGSVSGILNKFKEMDPKPTKAIFAAETLSKNIFDFLQKTPLLVSLSSKAMEDRHWDKINQMLEAKRIDMKWTTNSSHNLAECTSNNLTDFKTELQDVSDQAEKEYKNLLLLNKMVTEWDGIEIKLKSWKDTGGYAIVGDSVDEIQTILDDHIIQTQTMKGSQYAKIFEVRIGKWESDLLYIRDTLNVWLKVQAAWIYLQPIFASPDIKRELQKEDAEFTKVNLKWKEIMSHSLNNARAIKLPEDQSLKETLKGMLEKLEGIQDRLFSYLDKKRTLFPRFYFLSEDSLIEVLSEARDATKIQKYVKVLFEGIKSLAFDSNSVILGMTSSEGEFVKFEQPIPTIPHQGLVEAWIAIVEETMMLEIRKSVEVALVDYERMPREECRLR